MGGTSTDVSRYAGQYVHTYDTELAGVTVQAPQLDITTIASGGGSKLTFQAGLMKVGPESVGAHPGPVCYRKGGQLAITDANLVLGRLLPDFFPHIFGATEDQPLDIDSSRKAFRDLTDKINAYNEKHHAETRSKSPEQVAYGYIEVANESMCRPIREITEAKGFSGMRAGGAAQAQSNCATRVW
jgi:5-oxoprolinase (ATP-hydrolysing)